MSKTISITIFPSQATSVTSINNVESSSLSRSGNDMSLDVPAYKSGKAYYTFSYNFTNIFTGKGYTVPSGSYPSWVRISSMQITASTSTTAVAATKQFPYVAANRKYGSMGNWNNSVLTYKTASTNFGDNLNITCDAEAGYSLSQDTLNVSVGFDIQSNVQWAKRTYKITGIQIVLTVEVSERNYTFLDGNNNTFASGTVEYYKLPTTPSGTPTKSSTAQYEYTFSSWSYPSNQYVASPLTVTAQFTSKVRTYYLDLNGWLDGASSGNISGYGVADVYINGSRVAAGVTDFYTAYAYGTTYQITNIQPTAGHNYNGVYSGSLTGTISGGTSVYLNFTTAPTTVTVSFDSQGGSVFPSRELTIGGTYGTLPTPTKSFNEFLGWYTSTSYTTKIESSSIVPSNNHTLYAKWQPIGINNIRLGGNAPSKIYIGSQEVKQVYIGSTLVYSIG